MEKQLRLLFFSFIGWIFCGIVMYLGMKYFSLETALILHLILAPVFFTVLSAVYYKKFGTTTPLYTASIFLGFVLFMDFFLVALLIEKSMNMFRSPIGTWIPFILIFLATYTTGKIIGSEQTK